MAALVWDQIGDRLFEAGVSNGVLYEADGTGIPWNGLISVQDNSSDQVEPVFFDGQKINDVVTPGDYTGVLKAYTYPEEFLKYEGILEYQSGFYVTHQPRALFGLSYKTLIGNDVDGQHHGYKLHLIYNITAIPQEVTYETLSLEVEPIEFEWNLSAIPEEVDFFRPTAHVIFDSTKMDPYLLADIEDILYGSEDNDARLPSLTSLVSFVRSWQRLVITDHGDGTWSAYSPIPGVIEIVSPTEFSITTESATYLDADTYEIESSEKNEGDIWLP